MLEEITLILILTLLMEIITLVIRFGLKMSSKSTMINLMKKFHFKYIPHFHHGLIGIILIIFSVYFGYKNLLILGPSLILSDAFHHLFVLWPIVGHPEFHLLYKNKKYYLKEQLNEDKKIKRFFNHLIHQA